jgi:hypothetical protein
VAALARGASGFIASTTELELNGCQYLRECDEGFDVVASRSQDGGGD